MTKKKTITQLKVGKIFEQTLHQRRSMNEEEAHEKMFNIISG